MIKITLLIFFCITFFDCISNEAKQKTNAKYQKNTYSIADSILYHFIPNIDKIDTLNFPPDSLMWKDTLLQVGRLFGGQTKFAKIEYHYKISGNVYPIYSTYLFVYQLKKDKWKLILQDTTKNYAVYKTAYSQLIYFNGDNFADLLKIKDCSHNGSTGCVSKLWLYNPKKDSLDYIPKFGEISNGIYDKESKLVYSDYSFGSYGRGFWIYEWFDNKLILKQEWQQYDYIETDDGQKYDMVTTIYDKGVELKKYQITNDRSYFPAYLPKFFLLQYEAQEMQIYGN
jgi:hypothetical protein